MLGRGPTRDLVDAQIGVRTIRQPDGGRRPADFLNGDNMFQIAKAKAAIFLRNRQAVKPKRTHGGPQFFPWEPVIGIDFGGQGRDFIRRKALRGIADHVGIFAEGKV